MAATFECLFITFSKHAYFQEIVKVPFVSQLVVAEEKENLNLVFKPVGINEPGSHVPEKIEIHLDKDSDGMRLGSHSYVIAEKVSTLLLQFPNEEDLLRFRDIIDSFRNARNSMRTDESSAQLNNFLSQHQFTKEDCIRTSTSYRAILANLEDFKDKVILHVGCGVLPFIAAQAGARKVYVVKAGSMANLETLVHHKLSGRVVFVPGKIEEINLPDTVDMIISEPVDYILFYERMLETIFFAKKFLSPNGKMFPSRVDLHIAPFSDDTLYMEQLNKANFWDQQSFFGVDIASLHNAAVKECFRQPIVDTFDINRCLAKSLRHTINFPPNQETDLHKIDIPLSFTLTNTGIIHGLAFWFDVAYFGSQQTSWMSTAPHEQLTHWYQVRCLIETPLFARRGEIISGKVVLNSNKRKSYADIDLMNDDNKHMKAVNTLDLKNPFFRYKGLLPQAPSIFSATSPSEGYWLTLDAQTANYANILDNDIAAQPEQFNLNQSSSHQTSTVVPIGYHQHLLENDSLDARRRSRSCIKTVQTIFMIRTICTVHFTVPKQTICMI